MALLTGIIFENFLMKYEALSLNVKDYSQVLVHNLLLFFTSSWNHSCFDISQL